MVAIGVQRPCNHWLTIYICAGDINMRDFLHQIKILRITRGFRTRIRYITLSVQTFSQCHRGMRSDTQSSTNREKLLIRKLCCCWIEYVYGTLTTVCGKVKYVHLPSSSHQFNCVQGQWTWFHHILFNNTLDADLKMKILWNYVKSK